MNLARVYISVLWKNVYIFKDIGEEYGSNYEVSFDVKDLEEIDSEKLKDFRNYIESQGKEVILHAPYTNISFGTVTWCGLEYSRNIFKKLLEVGKELNVNTYIFHTLIPGENDLDAWFDDAVITIAGLISQGGERIKICIENVFENKTDLFDKVFSRFFDLYPENIFRCLDIGHANLMYGYEGMVRWLEFLDPLEIMHIHIHDNNGKLDEHLPLGTGTINFPEVFKILSKKRIYPGVTIENFDDISLGISFKYILENL